MTTIKAVLFDVGGVLVASPVTALHQYERLCGLPSGFVNKAIAYIPHVRNVWGEWECNKITFAEFCGKLNEHIQAELDRSLTEVDRSQIKKRFDTREMIDLMERYSGSKLNDKLVQCAATLRKKGIITCIITNNWYSDATENDLEILMSKLRPHFDHIIESRLVGMRKPNPAIFKHALEVKTNSFYSHLSRLLEMTLNSVNAYFLTISVR
jgi:epoxide hydrolase-like predicted phosphatase